MAIFLAPLINEQQEDVNGNPLSGGTISVYYAGTSTPAATYTDATGANPNAWPINLNTLGLNAQGSVWLTGGAAYKYVVKDSNGIVQRTVDNVSGINDTTVAIDQWVVYQAAPTYISATSFSVSGDQTGIFQVNRRVRTTNTGGVVTSTIRSSVYTAPNTIVTVTNDSGVLDAGLSAVSYGLISAQNSSILPSGIFSGTRTFAASGALTPADIGKGVFISTAGITVQLPLISNVPVGAAFHFTSGVRFTIQSLGSDLIDNLTSSSSLLVAAGNFTLIATATGWGVSIGYSKNVQASAGYSYLPNGVLMQWGTSVVASDGSGQAAFPFPIGFPTNVFTTIGSIGDNGDNKTLLLGTTGTNLTVARWVFIDCTTGAGRPGFTARINWVAFGN